MIDRITGVIKEVEEQSVVVQVGPVAVRCQVPQSALFVVGTSTELFMYLHWNQEQGPSLFGFATQQERTVFLLIIDCQGIGPKIGLATIAHLGAEGFLQAVVTDDQKTLSSVSGIGARKAEHIIVQSKHKAAKLIESGFVGASVDAQQRQAVMQALTALNYNRTEIAHALQHLGAGTPTMPFDQMLRQALAYLAKRV